MFNNYQHHYDKSIQRGLEIELAAFNPVNDRIKLIISAILIPVSCSFFYHIQAGHKITGPQRAVTEVDRIYSLNIDGDQITNRETTDKPTSDVELHGHTLSFKFSASQPGVDENNTGRLSNVETGETISASVGPAEKGFYPWQSITESAGFTTGNKAPESATYTQYYEPAKPRRPASINVKTVAQSNGTHPSVLRTFDTAAIRYRQLDSQLIIETSKNNSFEPDFLPVYNHREIEKSAVNTGEFSAVQPQINRNKLLEEESGNNRAEKLNDLLESDITSTTETTDTGNQKRVAKRNSNPAQNLLDVNKLESMLGDI